MEPRELRADLGASGGELTRLLPDLGRRLGGLPAPVAADPDTERHRLHTAVTELLARVSRRQPVLLVLEDVHWADEPTLLLVRHFARSGADARMLLVASFRDAATDIHPRLSETLVDLRRADDVVRLRLGGLSQNEVVEFLRQMAGGELGAELPQLARAVGELTDGNAFLVCELWRALVETGALVAGGGILRLSRPLAEIASPESVREVVSERLSRLAPQTGALLELAAVVGPEFDLGVVRHAVRLDEPELAAAVEEAERSGMIDELPARSLAYRFSHELVRRALLDRLTGLRRAELHRRVGEALEELGAMHTDTGLVRLAHHFAVAAPLGIADRAVEYSLGAARLAMASLAYEEAADRLRTALDIGIADVAQRGEALLDLGTARSRGGRTMDALEAYRSAAAIAREHGDAELTARAAIGFEDASWRAAAGGKDAIELLEEAASALGEEETPLRVMVLGGLSRALAWSGDLGRSAPMHADAIAIARRLGEHRPLASVLVGAYWQRGAIGVAEVLVELDEARELGVRLAEVGVQCQVMSWRAVALVGLGDLGRRPRGGGAPRDGRADRSALPPPRGGARRLGAVRLRGTFGGGRAAGRAVPRVGASAHRS